MNDSDFEWYLHNIGKLYKDYPDQFVVIHNKQVIDSCKTYTDGVIAGALRFPLGEFIVQYVTLDDDYFTEFEKQENPE